MADEKSWNEQLADWARNHPDQLDTLRDRINRSTLNDYLQGRITKLDRMSKGRKSALYEVTGLEIFKIEE